MLGSPGTAHVGASGRSDATQTSRVESNIAPAQPTSGTTELLSERWCVSYADGERYLGGLCLNWNLVLTYSWLQNTNAALH